MTRQASRLIRWPAAWALGRELGAARRAVVIDVAAREYEPPPPLARTAGGRLNLEMAAYLLALRDGLVTVGYDADEASRLLARNLYRVMKRFYGPMDALAVAAHPLNQLARARWRQRVSQKLFFRPPDWLMTELPEAETYAFDVRRCALADYLQARGEQRFCRQVFCEQDLLMAAARRDTLTRTRTIASGGDRCDFRFSAPRSRSRVA